MHKPIAILIYPSFSVQEVANCMGLFRWYFNSPSHFIASSADPVLSEEGMQVLPNKLCADFAASDYDCLILPGCSDFRPLLADAKLKAFLQGLKEEAELVIGAICGGPFLLSWSGLLQGKRFVNQLYADMNEAFPFIEQENFVCAPLVEEGNILTAIAPAYAAFAIALARKIGYPCPDNAYREDYAKWEKNDYQHRMNPEELAVFRKEFSEFIQ